jgi:hypothetical protein
MTFNQPMGVAPVVFAIFIVSGCRASRHVADTEPIEQQGRWAAAGNATAKFVIDAERQ